MTDAPKRVLLLVGSPKGSASTSEALGTYLLEQLEGQGGATEVARIVPSLRFEEGRNKLLHSVASADLLLLASPLYADSLPSGVTRLFEIIGAEGKEEPGFSGTGFAAVINCGFPEARQCDTAIAICRCFAKEAGMEWMGGLALGGGESIGGRPLREAGGVARNARKALDLAAAALAGGRQVPDEVVSLMAKQTVSPWLYTVIGDIGWRLRARKHKAGKRMKDRPYLP
ncbi:MAG: NAD(P)H-dependent oxidoreductase [Candidatus Deferrimicrobiaceae bacterium]